MDKMHKENGLGRVLLEKFQELCGVLFKKPNAGQGNDFIEILKLDYPHYYKELFNHIQSLVDKIILMPLKDNKPVYVTEQINSHYIYDIKITHPLGDAFETIISHKVAYSHNVAVIKYISNIEKKEQVILKTMIMDDKDNIQNMYVYYE